MAGVLAAALILLARTPIASAVTEAEQSFLSLYFTTEELRVFSTTRSLRSVASVAENVTVVTSEDIELMNAHTVAEALYCVTGIEITDFKGPGSGGAPSIQSSGTNRVTVMLDGVPLNTANNDFPLSRLPVQMIDKVEIIKGPASSTWGSSFGGVINVLTKSAASGDRVGGTAYASLGQKDTSDLRAELSGWKGGFGIYLFGGTMNSDGVQDDHEFSHGDFFAKASVGSGPGSRLDVTLYYHDGDSASADRLPFGFDVYEGFDEETLYGKAEFRTSFSGGVDLNLSAWTLNQDDNFYEKRVSDDAWVRNAPTQYHRYGFRGDVVWRTGRHVVVAGADFMDGRLEHHFEPRLEIDQQQYGLFVNDTITAGSLCITPGLRYDHSNLAGGLASPSLGMTYLASRDLLFRALVTRGFHDPPIVKYFDAPAMGYYGNENLKPETIWSYQAGVEANISNLLRAKLTLFYHDIDDILVEKVISFPRAFTTENGGSARTVGGEFEIATNRFKGLSLEAGASYEQTKLLDFTDPLYESARDVYGFNGAVSFDAGRGLRATVKGHYFWWDMIDRWQSDSDGVIVDANVIKEVVKREGLTLDAFFTAHNIFNESSFSDFLHQNPDRWLEAGVRCSF
jgi:vitamin B12 transporter